VDGFFETVNAFSEFYDLHEINPRIRLVQAFAAGLNEGLGGLKQLRRELLPGVLRINRRDSGYRVKISVEGGLVFEVNQDEFAGPFQKGSGIINELMIVGQMIRDCDNSVVPLECVATL
jgi:hypothetical protein